MFDINIILVAAPANDKPGLQYYYVTVVFHRHRLSCSRYMGRPGEKERTELELGNLILQGSLNY